jgi:hypothetical protein
MTLQDDRPNAVTVAREARALIENPDRWTVGHYAETARGNPCNPTDRLAARWCAVGAVRVCEPDDRDVRFAVGTALWNAALSMGAPGAATVNDRRGHDAVLKMYDRAIELLEQEAAAA